MGCAIDTCHACAWEVLYLLRVDGVPSRATRRCCDDVTEGTGAKGIGGEA
ncbi:MAG TPA: hypothetical protein PKE00_08365 [Planctomycetota bacterium]|nr:hypothetical protein [Planctomycetota bacterium]